jgi:hypothetical protein
MIEVHGGQDSAEGRAANRLAQLIIDADSEVETSGNVHVAIVSRVQCYGQSPQDIDLVLLGFDRRPNPFRSSSGARLTSFCVTIELKAHSPPRILFEGSTCFVVYGGDEHNASLQSESQKYSLKRYLERTLGKRSLFVSNLLWLTGLSSALLPTVSSNLLGSDANWQVFVDRISLLSVALGDQGQAVGTLKVYFDAKDCLCKRIQPGAIDRRKMEAIVKRVISADRQYIEKLGTQLLVLRGRGGTGKTVRLLQLAHQMYREREERVLVLTFNNALAADIRRLLALLGISDGLGEPGIGVLTVHKLLREWLVACGLLERSDDSFLDRYAELKAELLSYLRAGALSNEDVLKRKRDHSRSLSWTYLLVDECQDWPIDERDILYLLYSTERFVLADGVDQLVRSSEAIDWREPLDRAKSQVVSLRKSLRLKSGLCEAVSDVARELRVTSWDLEPVHDLHGGRVVVLAGVPYGEQLHGEVAEAALVSGNCNVDTLFCVPPEGVRDTASGGRRSRIADDIEGWGYKVWDGASYETRTTYPTSHEQFRVVQYDSCRGLEGWTVVCLSLDRFFDFKRRQYKQPLSALPDLFINDENLASAFASRWLMIPLTRAIDTLVLVLDDPHHHVAKVLRRVYEVHRQTIEWRS